MMMMMMVKLMMKVVTRAAVMILMGLIYDQDVSNRHSGWTQAGAEKKSHQ